MASILAILIVRPRYGGRPAHKNAFYPYATRGERAFRECGGGAG